MFQNITDQIQAEMASGNWTYGGGQEDFGMAHGGLLGGGGGGMSDVIPGDIGGCGPGVGLSPGEWIVPADVVSMLGDGDTESGSELLYDMIARIRETKTGTPEQAPALANSEIMLPA
jgi:hypothetical protein